MAKIKDYVNLMRVRQWYKNLIVFLALIFAEKLFHTNLFLLTIVAFFSLSFVSSSGYIINDIIDRNKDALHPEKKSRPIASGKVKIPQAIIFFLALLVVGLIIAYILSPPFFIAVSSLFILTQIYSLYLKHILFADILTISTLFVIRALSGTYIIESSVSPWLILCPFFLASFLSVGKRHSDKLLMKENSKETRKVLDQYTPQLTNNLMNISITLLIICFTLYSFLSGFQELIYTLPLGLYTIFRFYYLISYGSIIARHPEKMIHDKPLIIGALLWSAMTIIVVYMI